MYQNYCHVPEFGFLFIIIMLILPVYQAIDKSTRKYFKHEEYSSNAV